MSDNQADLLKKLDMIKEAVERNPEQWWNEIELRAPAKDWRPVTDEAPLAHIFNPRSSIEFRLKPQRKWVEGWVDAAIIEKAYEVQGWADSKEANEVAQALLQLVKEEGDG